MNNILSTGMSGLVGTRVKELLSDEFDFFDLSLSSGIDITDSESLEKYIKDSDAKYILHMAAKTDVDACEDEKIFGEESSSWLINVKATENIAIAAKKKGMKVVYISTDFVFDGTKEKYYETDQPNPVNWYGYTKYEGEKVIEENTDNYAVLRIAYPYRSFFPDKKDFVRRLIEKMKSNEKILGLTDHIITPSFIDDIAYAIKTVLQKDLQGIYHVVGSESLSVFECIKVIGNIFGYVPNLIPIKREVYFKDKAFRPFKLTLKNDKISESGVYMNTLEKGLQIVKKQIKSS